jgi:predicted helicase
MLKQHLLTERIFRSIFDNPDFVRRNAIARELEKVVEALTSRAFSRDRFLGQLDYFYRAIENAAQTIDDYSEKQSFLHAVYEQFFQSYSTDTADTHGIVYTPAPIVRWMVASVEQALQREFGLSLGDKGVHILDPCVGTGTFILELMEHIGPSALPHKYAHELHCNEVLLLPYYIAAQNIEHEYYSGRKLVCPLFLFYTARSRKSEMRLRYS